MTERTIDLTPYRAIPYVTPHLDHPGDIVWLKRNWRCTGCGHRLTVLGVAPVATRKLPFWTWPLELIDRHRAKHGSLEMDIR